VIISTGPGVASEPELGQHSFAYSQTIFVLIIVVVVAAAADDDDGDVNCKGLRYCWFRICGIHG
jgi:hypothetical protein